LIKVDWLNACLALRAVGAVSEDMSQTQLTNKKQGNLDQVHAANIIIPTQTSMNRKTYTFCVVKSLEHLKNLNTGPVPYLGRELTMHVIKSQIHLMRQSLKGAIQPD
jgi:hypothetical protein